MNQIIKKSSFESASDADSTELDAYNKICAYVLSPTRMKPGNQYISSKRRYINIPEDTVDIWDYTENAEAIIQSPISGVIFVDNKDDSPREAIMQKYSFTPLVMQFPELFDTFVTEDIGDKFCINPDPIFVIDHGNYRYHAEKFAEYLKKIDQPYDYSHWEYSSVSTYEKEELNSYNIYVQPVKKLFSYNPILAKRQSDIIKAADERRRKQTTLKPQTKVTRYHLQSLHYNFRQIFSTNLGLHITYNEPYQSYRKKVWYAEQILVSVDMFNLIFKKYGYRDLLSFKDLCKYWRNMSKEERNLYPVAFINWINIESKIKPRRTKFEAHKALKPRTLKIFDISKIKWRYSNADI